MHEGRCYGPPMAKSDVKEWANALRGFTKESFEADGKRRDIYRAGSGPAVAPQPPKDHESAQTITS